MALIKCPECKKKISDQCEKCPNCGYPIRAGFANNDTPAENIDNVNEATVSTVTESPKPKKPIFKRVWFWIGMVAVLIAVAVTVILLINREVKVKVDENGNPVFVELTNEVYTNSDEYRGYFVNVKGKVFQNLGDYGDIRGIQVWIDPENSEKNLMIYYTTGESFQEGDYVICTGYIKEVQEYTNSFGGKRSVPLIYSTDLMGASYIEVMSPTVSTIMPENLSYEQLGYSVAVDKVEFAENETRLYFSATNNGSATLYLDTNSSVIVQNGKQFNATTNYEADYETVPQSLKKGTTASGIVTFPAIVDDEFEYELELSSENYDERLKPVTFHIGKEESSATVPEVKPNAVWEFDYLKYKTKGYTISIEKIEFYDDETRLYLTADNDGKAALSVNTDSSVIVQNHKQYNAMMVLEDDLEELPYRITTGATASGVVIFPKIEEGEFEYSLEIYSDDYTEEFKSIVFSITNDSPACKNEENEVWRITTVVNSDYYDFETDYSIISMYDPLCIHMIVEGGAPREVFQLGCAIALSNGEVICDSEIKTSSGDRWVWNFENGIQEYLQDDTTGTIYIFFFNAETIDLITSDSVYITNYKKEKN